MSGPAEYQYVGEVPIFMQIDGRYRKVEPGDKVKSWGEILTDPDGGKHDVLELNGFVKVVKKAARKTAAKKTTAEGGGSDG